MRSKTEIVEKCRAFLAALSESGSIKKACKVARVPRATVYEWKSGDPAFAKAWDEARVMGGNALEDSLTERAKDGVLKPVFQGGKRVGTIREYDTTAAIFLLKGIFPEKYRERGTLDLNVIPNLPARLDAAEKRLKEVKEGP